MIIPNYFWKDAINIACHFLSRVIVRTNLEKTPYELFKGRKLNISYFCILRLEIFYFEGWKREVKKV